jgi:hypothetical protein
MDAVLREMERKHRMERRFLSLLLLDNALEDLRFEAREISEDERQKRLTELKDERDALDLDEKGLWNLIVSFRQRGEVLTLVELISMYSLNV